MSVLDEVATVERKIAARIRELAPLAAEHERLRQSADKPGIDLTEEAKPRSRRRGARSAARKQTTARKPAASTPKRASRRAVKATGNGAASRADQLAELVRRKPGLTVREVAEQLGVKDRRACIARSAGSRRPASCAEPTESSSRSSSAGLLPPAGRERAMAGR